MTIGKTIALTRQNFVGKVKSLLFNMMYMLVIAFLPRNKRLLYHHNLKALILQRSAFFMGQLSHPYMTIGKTIALTIWAFVSKVMSLLFNIVVGICNHIKEYYIYYLFCFSGEP